MTDRHLTVCGYGADRDEVLIAYLFDDIEPADRASFDAHLATCDRCRTELADLGGVRKRLGAWDPPKPQSSVFGHQSSVQARLSTDDSRLATHDRRLPSVWWRAVPVWAQVAAALLVLGVSAGIANLDVHYNQDGLTVRTGWSKPSAIAAASVVPAQPAAAAWRSDLTALERQLREEFRAAQAATAARQAAPPPAANEAEIVRRVRGLLDESEHRQQRELALRLAEVLRDVNAQRNADLVRIDRSLGIVQNNTGVEVAKQRELLNYLVRVSSQK